MAKIKSSEIQDIVDGLIMSYSYEEDPEELLNNEKEFKNFIDMLKDNIEDDPDSADDESVFSDEGFKNVTYNKIIQLASEQPYRNILKYIKKSDQMEDYLEEGTSMIDKDSNSFKEFSSEFKTKLNSALLNKLTAVKKQVAATMVGESAKEKMEEDSEYQEFFSKKLEKWGVKSPAELDKADKKKFFDEIDSEWKGEKESD